MQLRSLYLWRFSHGKFYQALSFPFGIFIHSWEGLGTRLAFTYWIGVECMCVTSLPPFFPSAHGLTLLPPFFPPSSSPFLRGSRTRSSMCSECRVGQWKLVNTSNDQWKLTLAWFSSENHQESIFSVLNWLGNVIMMLNSSGAQSLSYLLFPFLLPFLLWSFLTLPFPLLSPPFFSWATPSSLLLSLPLLPPPTSLSDWSYSVMCSYNT